MISICLWSGGKDSCLACYKAIGQGHKVVSLFNFTAPEGEKSLSHNLPAELIRRQAEAVGIPLLQQKMSKENYSADFKKLVSAWKKKEKITAIVFGDIYLQEHKDWIDNICKELDIKPILPLWKIDSKQLLQEFITLGFKAVVVAARNGCLGKEWLDRRLDKNFVQDIEKMGDIDFCGEKGEFHTFVYDGPLFKKAVDFKIEEKIESSKYSFLELAI